MSDTTPEPDEWSMSDEREFIETLLCERFNFFLVIFGATIAGVVTVTTRQHLLLLLWSAAVIQFLMMLTLWRAQCKFNRVFAQLKKDQPCHPAITINNGMEWWSVRDLIGYWIPLLCTAAVIVALVCATLGYLTPSTADSTEARAESSQSPPVVQPNGGNGAMP
jgi:hypothetical protein